MTTETLRRNTKELTERNATNDARQAGAIARSELVSLQAAALERMGELVIGGYYAEARAMHRREFERGN